MIQFVAILSKNISSLLEVLKDFFGILNLEGHFFLFTSLLDQQFLVLEGYRRNIGDQPLFRLQLGKERILQDASLRLGLGSVSYFLFEALFYIMDLRDFLLPTAQHTFAVFDLLVPDAGILSDGLVLPLDAHQVFFRFLYFLGKYPFFVQFLLDELLFYVGRFFLHGYMTFHDGRFIGIETRAKCILLLICWIREVDRFHVCTSSWSWKAGQFWNLRLNARIHVP